MKKLLSLMLAVMMLPLAVGAQGLAPRDRFVPRAFGFHAAANSFTAPARIDLPANQKILGHYDSDALSSNGFRAVLNFTGVIPVATDITPDELEMFQGGKIIAFRVGLASKATVSRVFVIPIDSDGNLGAATQWSCSMNSTGWITVELETPYEINLPEGTSLRIGFDVKHTSSNNPLSVVNEGDIYPSYYFMPNVQKWYKSDISKEGNLSVQCIVESDLYPDYLIENKNLEVSSFIKMGEDIGFFFQTRNHGLLDVPVGACTYDVAIDGNKVATFSNDYAFADSFIYLQESVSSQGLAVGEHTLSVTTATINGEPVENPKTASTAFRIYEYAFPHKMHLVEQFTSTYCTWCPLGIGLIKRLTEIRDDIAWIGFHGSMGTDPFRIPQCDSIMSLEGTFAYPTGSFDRLPGVEEEGSIITELGYDTYYYDAAAEYFSAFIDHGAEEPAWAQVNINTTFDANTRLADITVGGEMADVFDEMLGADSRLTVYLIEDHLIAEQINQGTWIENFEHNGVFRQALGSVKGVALNRDGNAYSNHFTYTIPADWKVDDLKVVAFISRPLANGGNYNDMRVNNVNMCKLGESTPINVMLGDLSGDGLIDVTDVVMLIDVVLNGDLGGVNKDAADVNVDGILDVSDVTLLVDRLLTGVWFE
jgi:hypothetical protein